MENPALIDYTTDEKVPYSNITLRDLFAGLTLAGMIANPDPVPLDWALENFPKTAYKYADAMLATRESKPTPQQDNVDTWEVN